MNNLLQQIVDKKYKIQPNKQYFRDGGSIGFTVKCAGGKIEYLFLDKRMESPTKGEFYTGNFPGKEGAVSLGKNDALALMIEQDSTPSLLTKLLTFVKH